jgi:hypothetical protein
MLTLLPTRPRTELLLIVLDGVIGSVARSDNARSRDHTITTRNVSDMPTIPKSILAAYELAAKQFVCLGSV